MKQINANLKNADKAPNLRLDNGNTYEATLENPSRGFWRLPDSETGGATVLWASKQGRLIVPPSPGSWEASLPPVEMDPPVLDYAGSPSSTGRLSTSGRDFIQDGNRWVWKGSSDFRLLQWLIEGRPLDNIFAQRNDCGANILRVFGMYNGGIGRFIPSEYGNAYWDGIRALAKTAGEFKFQIELTAMADCQTFLNDSAQHDYWNRLTNEVQGIPNLVVEIANEYKKNGVDPSRFAPIPNILCSRGSGLSDEAGFTPGWNYHTWHGRRDWPKVLFSAEDMWYVGEGYGPAGAGQYPVSPITHDEPIGFADSDQPGRRSADPYVARVIARTSSAYGAGATFHSDYGIQSQMWSPHVEGLARIFFTELT